MKKLLNFFAARLAFRQLTSNPKKMVAALFGVTFAVVLVFMQLGFKSALFTSAIKPPSGFDGQLFILDAMATSVWKHIPYKKEKLMRALGHPKVTEVTPIYINQAMWKNPVTKGERALFVYGFDPISNSILPDQVAKYTKELLKEDYIIFDTYSRPEFGPIGELIKKGSVKTEVNDHAISVVGTFELGASFAADGNIFASINNFLRIIPNRTSDMIDVGVIRIDKGVDIEQVKRDLQNFYANDVQIMTKSELIEFELDSWEKRTPIGFVFGFGTLMGLIVGMVIVYQILFTDITNNLPQYATLKAMGYSDNYLSQNIFFIAFFLAVLGFVPGLIMSWGLYHLTHHMTYLPIEMTLARILLVFSFILSMCFISGTLAMRKLKSADPAEMF